MTVTLDEWTKYRDLLAKLSDKAAEEFRDAVWSANGKWKGVGLGNIPRDELVEYAYALVTKYGEGAATLACEYYDALAELSNMSLSPAVPAETATIGEVGKALNGSINYSENEEYVSNVVGRLVKQAGQDTTLQNAKRDGAQFAWIPSGDTCAFCLTLASNGWQYVSKKALKNGHAEHIHSNCDCAYAVRFDSKTNVEGYDPDEYKKMYYGAEGSTPQEKINSMRREMYAEQKEGEKKPIAKTLPKAKNREEAYNILNTMFGNIEPNVKNIEEQLLCDNINQLQALNQRFGAISEGNGGFFTASPSGKAMGWTSSSFIPNPNGEMRENTRLSLVGRWYKDPEALLEQEKKANRVFFSMPSEESNLSIYTVTHEYGHILENHILVSRTDYGALAEKVSSMVKPSPSQMRQVYRDAEKKGAKQIYDEIIAIAKENNPNFSLKENLSENGHTNYFEAFAEMFANSQLGQPNELGIAMQQWLEREGY